MRKLICYASGGLCNRIAPLLSCMAYKEKHLATELLICWEPTFRCFAEYTDIFEYPTDAKIITKKEMRNLGVTQVFATSPHDIAFDAHLYKEPSLFETVKSLGELYDINGEVGGEVSVVYGNTFIEGLCSKEDAIRQFEKLMLLPEITNSVTTFLEGQNQFDVGWHIRGTDFINDSYEGYFVKIQEYLHNHPDKKVFICSDEPEWEKKMKQEFPDNIYYREKQHHVEKLNPELDTWKDNTNTPPADVKEAMIDFMLLMRCDRIEANTASSFSNLAKTLKGES